MNRSRNVGCSSSVLLAVLLAAGCAEKSTAVFEGPLAERPAGASSGEFLAVLLLYSGPVSVEVGAGLKLDSKDLPAKLPLVESDRVFVGAGGFAILHLDNNHLVRLDEGVALRVAELAMRSAQPSNTPFDQQLASLLKPEERRAGPERIVGWHARLVAAESVAPQPVRAARRPPRKVRPVAERVALGPTPASITSVDTPRALALQDGSRLHVVEDSSLDVVRGPSGGEVVRLTRGALACQIQPRPDGRPFEVEAGPGRVRVKGTRFAVALDGERLTVAVDEGRVEVSAQSGPSAPIEVVGGQTAAVESGTVALVEIHDEGIRTLLELVAPEEAATEEATTEKAPKTSSAPAPAPTPAPAPSNTSPRPKSPAQPVPAPVSPTQAEGAKAPAAPVPAAPAAPAVPPPAKPETKVASRLGSIEDQIGAISGDGWVIEAIQAEIRRGRLESALEKISNYLLDPESQSREAATYLKAVCLEKQGHREQARETYRSVLARWPNGSSAEAAKAGLQRTSSP